MSTIPNEASFGKRLRMMRTERKLPIREVAELAGISPAHLSKIENGESQPTLPVLEGLARAFGLTLNALTSEATLKQTLPPSLVEFVDKYKVKYPELNDPAWQEALGNVRLRGSPPANVEDWLQIFSAMHFAYKGTQNEQTS
jgi:transcriptional regulator with XRE-family HTH domain